jgi:hypothetical protein
MGWRARRTLCEQQQSGLRTCGHGDRDGYHNVGFTNLTDLEPTHDYEEEGWSLAHVQRGSFCDGGVNPTLEESRQLRQNPEHDLYDSLPLLIQITY